MFPAWSSRDDRLIWPERSKCRTLVYDRIVSAFVREEDRAPLDRSCSPRNKSSVIIRSEERWETVNEFPSIRYLIQCSDEIRHHFDHVHHRFRVKPECLQSQLTLLLLSFQLADKHVVSLNISSQLRDDSLSLIFTDLNDFSQRAGKSVIDQTILILRTICKMQTECRRTWRVATNIPSINRTISEWLEQRGTMRRARSRRVASRHRIEKDEHSDDSKALPNDRSIWKERCACLSVNEGVLINLPSMPFSERQRVEVVSVDDL